MIPEKLVQLECELRQAAGARLYGDVRRLATEFCSMASLYANALPVGDPRVAEAVEKVDEVLGWAILMMQLARTACTAELERMRTTRRFLGGAEYRRSSVHLVK